MAGYSTIVYDDILLPSISFIMIFYCILYLITLVWTLTMHGLHKMSAVSNEISEALRRRSNKTLTALSRGKRVEIIVVFID